MHRRRRCHVIGWLQAGSDNVLRPIDTDVTDWLTECIALQAYCFGFGLQLIIIYKKIKHTPCIELILLLTNNSKQLEGKQWLTCRTLTNYVSNVNFIKKTSHASMTVQCRQTRSIGRLVVVDPVKQVEHRHDSWFLIIIDWCYCCGQHQLRMWCVDDSCQGWNWTKSLISSVIQTL